MADRYAAMLKPSPDEQGLADTIKRYIAKPGEAPFKDTPNGRVVDFSPAEKALFSRDTGLDEWYLPSTLSKQSRISDAVRRADADETYRSASSFSDYVLNGNRGSAKQNTTLSSALLEWKRGRESDREWLKDQISAVNSQLGERNNYASRFGRELDASDKAAKLADQQIVEATQRVEKWLRGRIGLREGKPLPDVPFWNSPLKTPERGSNEALWQAVDKMDSRDRTPQQNAFWKAHQYDGLSRRERMAYDLSDEIKYKMQQELRRDTVSGADPYEDYQPAMSRRAEVDTKPASLVPETPKHSKDVDVEPVRKANEVKLDTPVTRWVKDAPVMAEPVNLKARTTNSIGTQVFTSSQIPIRE